MTTLAEQPVSASAVEVGERPAMVLGSYEDVDAVMAAARRFRDAGYKRWDVFSPFPIHGIDRAMGNKPTILPWIVLACGLTGMSLALFLTIYTMSTELETFFLPSSQKLWGYPFMISGKPFNSLPAWIPVIFELTILLSAFGAVFGMFILNKLPMLYNPLFKSTNFRRVTDDRFFIGVDARDAKFGEAQSLLRETGAADLETVYD